ncbi:MAG: type II secretion system F family protein [Actinomycetes bacterium]
MPKFAYAATNATGETVKGTVKADSFPDARRELDIMNLDVTDIKQKREIGKMEVSETRIKRVELMNLSRQLAAFVRAGISILDAISELAEDADSRGVKRVLTDIGDQLREGSTLSEAVDRHPKDFPTFYRGILKSAELTGQLDTVLDQLSKYVERDLEARRKIKGAMTYPAVVAVMAVGTVVVLTAVVLPKFKEFFASLDAELPVPTRMMLAMSDWIQAWGLWVLLISLLLFIGFMVGKRTRRGRKIKDRVMLRIPVIGTTLRYSIIERFTRILASMVGAGVPLPEAMKVATDSLNNLVFEDALTVARQEMLSGGGLSGPIARTNLFPGMASQMMRVGEQTGTLDSQLVVAAGYYESELDYKVKRLATIIEPVVIVFMGSIVGFVAVALVSAMYGIFRAVNVSG